MDLGAAVRGCIRNSILRIVRADHVQIQHENFVDHTALQSVAQARVHAGVHGGE